MANKLRLSKSSDLKEMLTYNILLYGENGSGKTSFAGTFPYPVFLVPKMGIGEMRTLSGWDIPVVTFESMADLKEQITLLGKAIQAGTLRCNTIVFDNLTTTQLLFENEIKQAREVDKLDWEEWGIFTSFFVNLMATLSAWPVHSIWICHSDKEKTFTLKGDSKRFFPGNSDLLLYCDAQDLGKQGQHWWVYGRKFGTWPARIRLSRAHDQVVPFTRLGPDPHYDDLAPVLGLKSCAEIEGRS